MSLGQRLRQARREKGYTQKELAAIIDVKHNSISNWENDQNKPDLETVKRICETLKVSLSFLFEESTAGSMSDDDLDRILSQTEFALLGAVRQLTEEDKMDVLDFVLFKAGQKEKRRKE